MIHIASNKSNSVTVLFDRKQIQPNAIDLIAGKIFSIDNAVFTIDEEHKQHRATVELEPDEQGYWNLDPGCYEIIMQGTVTIAEGEAGWVITRSTLNRNGLFITSGLYDSGYQGVLAGALHVECGPARIKVGTRVGQFLLFKAESIGTYDGDYGVGKQHDEKYK